MECGSDGGCVGVGGGGRIWAHGSGHGCLGLRVGGAGPVCVPGVFEEMGGDASDIVVELGNGFWLVGDISWYSLLSGARRCAMRL